jgi:hypothetical protein
MRQVVGTACTYGQRACSFHGEDGQDFRIFLQILCRRRRGAQRTQLVKPVEAAARETPKNTATSGWGRTRKCRRAGRAAAAFFNFEGEQL